MVVELGSGLREVEWWWGVDGGMKVIMMVDLQWRPPFS